MTTSYKTLGDESPSYSTGYKWAAEFRRRKESVEDYEWSGRLKETTTHENVELVHILIMCDRRRSLRDIARQIIWDGSVCLNRYLRDV